jgi:2,3-diaminopropionate biosynthesis protein SbnB
MSQGDVLILKGNEVSSLLRGCEPALMDIVRGAYIAHAGGESVLPHSVFLHLPQEPKNRIIALPAYLGGEFDVAGIKWIASIPSNSALAIDRASAVVVLNSAQTGRPLAILEGSIISAKRTAASAVLAARYLLPGPPINSVGLIGCGLINFEIVRFLLAAFPELKKIFVFDQIHQNALRFKERVRELSERVTVEVATDLNAALCGSPLISFATTASAPYVKDFSGVVPGSTILHISLRDLAPELLLSCDNVVDDIDHVSRAQTSLHLAEQMTGHRRFIRCALADVLQGKAAARAVHSATTVFSPFGLGVLDLAVAKLIYDRASQSGLGTVMESFLPDPWFERAE